jgi:glyoxylase-like metal-dependent hydrolase (beta-lactamase superfamily II)
MQLAPGLHRVGSDLVNAYLVEDEADLTLIDAGIPGQWSDLEEELDAMGRRVDDIRGVILTHGDTDHRGFAERLHRDHEVPIFVHEADAALAEGRIEKKVPWGAFKLGPLLGFLWYAGRRGGLRVPPVSAVETFTGAVTLDLPGSVAIFVPAVAAVFVGDAMTTRHVLTGVEGPQPAPFTMDRAAALESLTGLESLEANWVLPGHGPPWSGGIAAAIRQVRDAAVPGK